MRLSLIALVSALLSAAPAGGDQGNAKPAAGPAGPKGYDVLVSLFESAKPLPDQLDHLAEEDKVKPLGETGWVLSQHDAIAGNFKWTLTAKLEEPIEPGTGVHVFIPRLSQACVVVTVDGKEVFRQGDSEEAENYLSPQIWIDRTPLAGDTRTLAITVSTSRDHPGGVSNLLIVRPSRELRIYRYSGLISLCGWALLAVALTGGWRQLVAAAVLGAIGACCGFALLPGDPTRTTLSDWQPLGLVALASAAGTCFLISEMRKTHAAGRENFPWIVLTLPYSLLVQAASQIRSLEPEPTTDPHGASRKRWNRLTLTYAAVAGASAGAVLAQWETLLEVFHHLFTLRGLTQFAFINFLSSGFLIPLHHTLAPGHGSHGVSDEASHASKPKQPWYWYVVIPLAVVPVELLGYVFHHAVAAESFSVTALQAALNAQAAGIATYCFAAACQAQATPLARRAAVAASYLGAVVLFPAAYVPAIAFFPYSWVPSPGTGSSSGFATAVMIAVTILAQIFLAAIAALVLAAVAFGAYAGAAAAAVEFKLGLPVWLRVLLALFIVELVYALLLMGAMRYASGTWEDAPDILFAGALFIVGWGAGLAMSLRKSDILSSTPSALQPPDGSAAAVHG